MGEWLNRPNGSSRTNSIEGCCDKFTGDPLVRVSLTPQPKIETPVFRQPTPLQTAAQLAMRTVPRTGKVYPEKSQNVPRGVPGEPPPEPPAPGGVTVEPPKPPPVAPPGEPIVIPKVSSASAAKVPEVQQHIAEKGPANAPHPVVEPQGNQPEHPGTTPRTPVQAKPEEVRQGQGGRTRSVAAA